MPNFVVLGCLEVGEKFLVVVVGGWLGLFHNKNAATADICQIRFFIYQNPCLLGGKILIMGVTFLGGLG